MDSVTVIDGIANRGCQPNSDDSADADISCRVYTQGDFIVPLTGAAKNNVGDMVYCSDDATFTFTATSNTLVGVCVALFATNQIILRLLPWELYDQPA